MLGVERIVRHLASYPTRHTLSEGNRAAAEWIAGELSQLPNFSVEIMPYISPAGPRVPVDTEVLQVVATRPGRTDRRVMVSGHFDSLNLVGTSGPGDFANVINNPAPGANDDASGVAVAMEVGRELAETTEHNLVICALSGEEQGLLGAKALAKRAREEGWTIDALLNNDTVGSSSNLLGHRDDSRVRVFSEVSTAHQSRELARYVAWLARNEPFGPKLVFRKDRLLRGGDHSPFNDAGFTAVRFVEVHEEYTRQHTPDDQPEFVDFAYLDRVRGLNARVARSLLSAGMAPTHVRVERAARASTDVRWDGEGAMDVFWRETTSAVWQGSLTASGGEFRVPEINVDDHVFAVGAVGGIPVPAG